MGNIVTTVAKITGESISNLVRLKKFEGFILAVYKIKVDTKDEMFIPYLSLPEAINMDDAMEVIFRTIFVTFKQELESKQDMRKNYLIKRNLSKEFSGSYVDLITKLKGYKQILNEGYRQVNQLPTLDDILNNIHLIYSDGSSISFNEAFCGVTHNYEDPNMQKLIKLKEVILKMILCEIKYIKEDILKEFAETEGRINLISEEEIQASIRTQQVEREKYNLVGDADTSPNGE